MDQFREENHLQFSVKKNFSHQVTISKKSKRIEWVWWPEHASKF